MLTPPNEAVAARDPDLPGLRLLLDPEALADALGTASARVQHLRYKPGASCIATVVTAEGAWLRVRALTPARFAEKGYPIEGRLGEARVWTATPARDREVPGLRVFWPEETRGEAIAALFGESHLARARLRPLSYRLGRRLVARLEHPLGSALLKLHAPGRFAQAQAGASLAAFLGHGTLERACAQTLALATRWWPGAPLDPRRGPAGVAAAGAALAEAHRAPHASPFVRSRSDEIAAVGRTLADACDLMPEDRPRIERLAARIAEALAATPADIGPIHGDFSADQAVLDGDRLRLIDWDRAGVGDRGADLGTFLARLDADHLWDGLPAAARDEAATALLDGYATVRAHPASIAALRLAHLAMLATEPFRRRMPDWPDATRRLLDAVEVGLDRLDPLGICDPALPQLATLCDPAGAQRVLDAAGAGRLTGTPRLVRHKAGRRALVELVAETEAGPRKWLAKTRSKRPDHASPALHGALRALGFDGRAGGAFGVPEAHAGPVGLRTFLMAHVPGRPLTAWLERGADPAPLRATGRALAALHAAPVDMGATWRAEDELDVADRALRAAAARDPRHADRIEPLRAWAGRLARGLSSGPPALLHRDFHPDQALIDGPRVWLLDLDLAAQGDRHVDLGNFLAHLTEYALRVHGDPHALAAQGQAFLDGYADGDGRWRPDVLACTHRLSLLRHLDICGRFPDREWIFAPLLDHLAEERLCA